MAEQPKDPKKPETAMQSATECPHCGEEIVIDVSYFHGAETVLRYSVRRD
jgi:hypothetical protein